MGVSSPARVCYDDAMYAGCRCPRCGDALLEAAKREGCDLLACRRCGGGFVGAAVGLRLLAVLEPDVSPVREGAAASPCPVCRADMRVVLASAADVGVDVCARHGVWFDGDDLEAVARAAARMLGKPVPKAVEAFAEHARAPRSVHSGAPAETPSWSSEPTRGGRGAPRRWQTFGDPGSPVEIAKDVGACVADPVGVAVDAVLLPVEITFDVLDGVMGWFH